MANLQSEESKWTIVQDMVPIAGYKLSAIEADVRERLTSALRTVNEVNYYELSRVVTLFECYLQVTGQRLNKESLKSTNFRLIADGFVGAIECETFFAARWQTRYNYRRLFIDLLTLLVDDGVRISYIPERPYSTGLTSLHTGDCVRLFRTFPINQTRAWIWHGWDVYNLNGKRRWLNLQTLAEQFPRDFVEEFYKTSVDYFSSRRSEETDFISAIAEFTAQYPGATTTTLLDPEFAQQFWVAFASHYLTAMVKTCAPYRVVESWYGKVTIFSQQYLFESALYAAPRHFPAPPKRKPIGGTKHLSVDESGSIRIEKLLTHVPIHLSQTEAVDILFKRLGRDVDLTIHWANCEAAKIWSAYQQRKKWETEGNAREVAQPHVNNGATWLTSRSNPNHLKNAAATIGKAGGYLTRETEKHIAILLPKGLTSVAEELGFPVSYSLLPHMAILVNEHPEITPAYLEKLEIFDDKGKLSGLIEDDCGWVLKSVKMRKGPIAAEQHIVLSPRALQIVQQVLLLTADPREYLRKHNNSDWKALFITTGKAFGNPKAVTKISEAGSNPDSCLKRKAQFIEHTGITEEEAADLVSRFSLPALRASKGVLKYVETCSGPKTAEYLGHKAYYPALLARYVPEPLRAFLQSRYVRIMQTGIIVQAMKDSPYLLEAACFQNEVELNTFLTNHILNLPTNHHGKTIDNSTNASEHTSPNEIERIVLSVDESILTLYASLELAMRDQADIAQPLAIYWNNIGTRLMRYIQEKQNAEPEHMKLLANAKAKANKSLVEAFFHG
ncbi:hypothetical protein [Massilia varians]|uniref:hypothetical protein n=1 Tax=Massilia varians TaxID=457921 RepID=UPI0025548BD4|nr:hypothetical protein [Massilia varians]MDK6078532.1 hypothetical protein [Massilia varians]